MASTSYCGTHRSKQVAVSAGPAVVSLHPAVAGWHHHTPRLVAAGAEEGGREGAGGREMDGKKCGIQESEGEAGALLTALVVPPRPPLS